MEAPTPSAAARPDSPEIRRRDYAIIGTIGLAHSTSHIFQFCLPPMFPLLQAEFGISYTALGSVLAAFYFASGIGQTFIGVGVDRWGGRRVLAAGMAALAGAILALAFAPAFWMFLPLAVIAGFGNSVFHPADFALLAARVHPNRTGRAFSIHAFGGTIGYVLSPVLLSLLGYALGWRIALIIAGLYGLTQATFIFLASDLLGKGAASAATAKEGPREIAAGFARMLVMPAMLAALVYLTMTAMAGAGVQAFAAASLSAIHSIDFRTATNAVTAYLAGNAIGILAGGFVADATQRHERVAAAGLFSAALLLVAGGALAPTFLAALVLFALAGTSVGVTSAARDIIIKKLAPRGATGRTFGLVYSGLDIGSMLAPLTFGWFLDHGMPHGTIYGIALVLALTVLVIRFINGFARANAAVPARA
ncbi:MAG: MFS transporter [Alphaproteobacteria bacterium]|nr:MFS transporter [Alphaproteobacteria bacterium]